MGGGGPAGSSSGRVGLLQRVLRQRILLAGQWNLLRMEEQGLLPGLLRPIAQLLQRVPRQCVLLASQWDLLRMEEQGLLRNMPALSSLGKVGDCISFWRAWAFGAKRSGFQAMQDQKDLGVGQFLIVLLHWPVGIMTSTSRARVFMRCLIHRGQHSRSVA